MVLLQRVSSELRNVQAGLQMAAAISNQNKNDSKRIDDEEDDDEAELLDVFAEKGDRSDAENDTLSEVDV